MKNCKTIAAALAVLALASCAKNASVKGVLKDAPAKEITVARLGVGTLDVLDTVKTGSDGSFSCKVPVAKGQPEFIYLFYGTTKVAALLLDKGEKAMVTADTLGHWTVEGSDGSLELAGVESRFAEFAKQMASTEDAAELGKAYVKFYRESVKYVMENSKSLTSIPVLYAQINNLPVFGQPTDALFFRSVCDSLKTVYPDSRYVKALDKEAERRQSTLNLASAVDSADQVGFPDLNMSDINGEKKSLSSVEAKAILLNFWDASDPAQKMMALDVILPLYEKYHPRGLEIYSVCLSPDKSEWASVVKAQKLPWINVNDGLGASSPSILLYNVRALPMAYLIADGGLVPAAITGAESLAKELDKVL